MTSFLYALNIGTLAAWLTVTGASTVAQVIRVPERLPKLKEHEDKDIELLILPMAMGSAPPSSSQDDSTAEDDFSQEAPLEPEEAPELPEIPELPEVPEAPELPELADLDPLPEIPSLPDGALKPKPRPATASNSGQPKQQARTTARRTSNASGRGTGTGDGTARGSGNSPVGSDRWAGGRMPKPIYPPSSRRNGEQGRVVVAFTVDERGYVVSARIISPSSHSALNEAALNSVRRWKFRPGPRASASRPIIFRLH